jgi:hypothetical protein
MGRPLRFILALPMIALVVTHPGRIESRPMPGNQAPRASRSESNPSPATLPRAVPCAILPCTVRCMALPDKPEPRLAEQFSPPGGFPRPEASRPEPKFGTRRSKRAWLLLAFAQHGAAGFDAYSTRRAVDEGHRELDPLMRPFAHSPAIYPAMQVGPALLDLLGYRMLTSQRRWARRIWWLPQAIATAGFIWVGTRNLKLPSLRNR